MKIFKRFTIDAAHRLLDKPELHGHSYKVEAWFEGPVVDGYVIRETELSTLVNQDRESCEMGVEYSGESDAESAALVR